MTTPLPSHVVELLEAARVQLAAALADALAHPDDAAAREALANVARLAVPAMDAVVAAHRGQG